MNTIPTLNTELKGPAIHLYAIYDNRTNIVCRVRARNRTSAIRIAEKAGYECGSINMEG